MTTMMELARRLFPICRSLTGDGVRETLRILSEDVSGMQIFEVPTGTKVFDWTVPKEWRIRDGWIKDSSGRKIVDFNELNLHVVGYSAPVDMVVPLEELKKHIYVDDASPSAVPYVTSYYRERFGFCMSAQQRDALPEGDYHMYIDSELFDGSLTYGEAILRGETEREVLISTYVCHPSMANNEISGPCVCAKLYSWLASLPRRRLTYRFVFIPETIGSITYLSRNIEAMKRNTIAGFVVSCVGDDRTYSIVESRYGTTLADRTLKNVLRFRYPEYKTYSFLKRGSDERQYNAPGVDLPVVAFCRSKYGEYPEYHTSADDLSIISEAGMRGALDVLRACVETLEHDARYRIGCLCEPQLGPRGLYPTVSKRGSYDAVMAMMNFIAYADGSNDLIEISDRIGVPTSELIPIAEKLAACGLIEEAES